MQQVWESDRNLWGAKVQREVDYLSASGNLSLARIYRSDDAGLPHAFGSAWTIDGIDSVSLVQAAAGRVMIRLGNGTAKYFSSSDLVTWKGEPFEKDRLVPSRDANNAVNGWLYYSAADFSIDKFDSSGILQNKSFINGRKLTFSGPSFIKLPTQIVDELGRSITLKVDQYGIVHSATLPDGSLIKYNYLLGPLYAAGDAADYSSIATVKLDNVRFQDGSSRSYVYDESQNITDEPAQPFSNVLTGIIDENSVRYATFQYAVLLDNFTQYFQIKGISTEHAGGVSKFSFDRSNETDGVVTVSQPAIGGTISTLSIGSSQTTAGSFQKQVLQGNKSQPAGSGCAATTSALSYDANGNAVSSDDFNGTRRCYAYDTSRNLRTVAVEGLSITKACSANLSTYTPSTSNAAYPERKTTMVWHPDWELETQEAAPEKITTWVYNGQADPIAGGTAACVTPATKLPDGKPLAVLCKRYEQATTDTTGALGLLAKVSGATQAWTYTYNQYGQVLTETTPKQSAQDSLSHTTTYVYYPSTSFTGSVGHTMGDVNTVSNPLGQLTTFTSYDKAGRLLSSQDPNSTVTSMTYWPRGWMHTQTVTPASGTPLTTTYDYWPTGLLKTVTMPDASAFNYAYDDAHRLTDVTDAAGNKMHYVLDNLGNRTSEQVSDLSGQLASTISRVYDQLDRVQSSTGTVH